MYVCKYVCYVCVCTVYVCVNTRISILKDTISNRFEKKKIEFILTDGRELDVPVVKK